jgi:tRNA nucleotidyltransferase (CCA-adding enzyme)
VIEKYNNFVSRVEELELPDDVDAKPILDVSFAIVMGCRGIRHNALTYPQGREIVQVLGATKPGQWTGQVLAEVVKWQLGHPREPKERCEEWLKAELVAGRISIEDVAPNTQMKRPKSGPKEAAVKKTKK